MASIIHKLPFDLREHIYNLVQTIRMPLKVLPTDLKLDIETYPLIKTIKGNYNQVFPSETSSLWIENALINLMNDNNGFNSPMNECFHQLFPESTDDEIRQHLRSGHHLMRLWNITPPNKRFVLYDISCDMLVHYI